MYPDFRSSLRPASLTGCAAASQLLPTIRAIVDACPSYGHCRVTALVNHVLRSRRAARVNAKQVLRILRAKTSRSGNSHSGIKGPNRKLAAGQGSFLVSVKGAQLCGDLDQHTGLTFFG